MNNRNDGGNKERGSGNLLDALSNADGLDPVVGAEEGREGRGVRPDGERGRRGPLGGHPQALAHVVAHYAPQARRPGAPVSETTHKLRITGAPR